MTEQMVLTDPEILASLRHIGIHEPVHGDPLHMRLVDALVATRGQTWGDQLQALRFEFNAEHLAAGKTLADARTDFEAYMDQTTDAYVEAGTPVSRARLKAAASETAIDLKRGYRRAELRERSMREYLKTLQSALDNHRTQRADWRAADVEHSRSAT